MKKILMVILDGFGLKEEEKGNAIKLANMQFFNYLWDNYPHATLDASGESVGLPQGQFGNSEVGHGAIGLGRKIKQRITVVSEEIKSKNILENEALDDLVNHVNTNDSYLHLMGLLSDGGVHSDLEYILELIPVLKTKGLKKLAFHVITDGRDTSRTSAIKYINKLKLVFKENNLGVIASVIGRYYAMDRDNKYDRTYNYYNMLTTGSGLNILNLETAINNCYLRNVYDEHFPPLKLPEFVKFEEHDALLWLNFRQDRARQIINAITNPDFEGFSNKLINNFKVCTLFEQDDISNVTPLFKYDEKSLYPIGEYFSDLGFTQARIAETEKYAHVTKFFNSEKNRKFKGTDNFLIPSPKESTYDQVPLMSIKEVTNQTIKCLEKDYDFILVNYANPDMVGHTGNLKATIEALQGLDKELEKLIKASEDNFYKVMILSDHGNADTMLDEEDNIITTHSTNPVPFILLDKNIVLREKGELINVAPTLLHYMDIAIPEDMKESKSLILEDV
ncbi:MAG: 2,3-bisphosphoglycerate-independent phosphoglycerate mutase [Bacilli bacterium]|nr:2,3-bisphosphoglycerate-independent phosphoglycerate mutase [Bacilli bacterium]